MRWLFDLAGCAIVLPAGDGFRLAEVAGPVVRRARAASGQRVELGVPAELPPVLADPVGLDQVLATWPETVLAAVEVHQPDCVVLDLVLAGIDGLPAGLHGNLRKKLDDPADPQLLLTEPGMGDRFVVPRPADPPACGTLPPRNGM